MLKRFQFPKINKEILKIKVIRLINLGVLKRKNESKWEAPTFFFLVCFISEFRKLGKELRGNPFQFLYWKICY